MFDQLDIFDPANTVDSPQLDMSSFDHIVLFFSGGKDSIACFLKLLDWGVPREKIELHHHNVDGAPGSPSYMDYPVTEDYVRKFAATFGVKCFFSWKEGGFRREMYRENALTAPTGFEEEDGTVKQVGGVRGKLNTRRKFPQVSPDLRVRWCSSALKIDVGRAVLNNSERFKGARTCVITGERAEESPNRAKYKEIEIHHSDKRDNKRLQRHVVSYRSVHKLTETEIWEIIERYRVHAHPCYYAGFSRGSCAYCIFGNPDQMATARFLLPEQFGKIASDEKDFGCTMKRETDIVSFCDKGTVHPAAAEYKEMIQSHVYTGPIIMDVWKMPAGAFGEGCGPS